MPQKKTSLEQSYLALVEFLMLSKRQIIEHGSKYGLSSMQAMTLFLLNEARPMNSFKKIFNCDASNVTGLVDGLEDKHMVSRYEHTTDRRVKMVRLEEKGVTVRAALLNEITGPQSYILTKLNPVEVNSFIQLVQKITTE
jgi:DNA-binding MarR family transcriptional regulator